MVTYKKFPNLPRLAWDSEKQMSFNTQVQRSGAGRTRTMTNLHYPDWTITTKINYLTDEQARQLFGFVAMVKGAYEPFLWKDPEDCHVDKVQLPLISIGLYQCVMKMGEYVEPTAQVEKATVYVSGVQQTPDKYTIEGGTIRFKQVPVSSAIVTATYDYYWLVRFKDDGMGVKKVFQDINRSKSFKLEVVR